MADGDVFGGAGWMQQFLDMLYNAAQQQYLRDVATGYITEGYEEARPAPTENEALDAIWQNRPDLKTLYDKNWGKGKYQPRDAVRDWLGMTREITGSRDPVQYALSQGWVQPGTEGKEGTKVPTLEREEWEKEFLRQQGLDEEAIRQWDEQMDLAREQQDEATRQWNEEFGRQAGLDEEAIRQWNAQFERQTGLDEEAKRQWNEEFLRQKGLDEEAIRQWQAQFDYQRQVDAQAQSNYEREFLRQQGLDEQAIREWEAEYGLAERGQTLQEQIAEWQQMNADREFLRQQGLDEESIRQWEAEHGLDTRRYELERELGLGELGLGARELDIRERLGQGEQALGYLGLLGSLRGPQDWMQYWNVQRQAQNTQLPQWAYTLMSGQQMPAFQGAAGAVETGIQLAPSEGQAQQNFAAMGQPFAQGHQVTPAQWQSLSPSEQAGVQSVIEYQGGYMNDWMKNMLAAAPKVGGGAGQSTWGGW